MERACDEAAFRSSSRERDSWGLQLSGADPFGRVAVHDNLWLGGMPFTLPPSAGASSTSSDPYWRFWRSLAAAAPMAMAKESGAYTSAAGAGTAGRYT